MLAETLSSTSSQITKLTLAMIQQNLLQEKEKALLKEQKEFLSQRHKLCVSRKLGENDTAYINGVYKKVFSLIESDPIALWNHIHSRGSGTSLNSLAYTKLKKAVNEANPNLIEENNKKRNLHNAKKKLVVESKITR